MTLTAPPDELPADPGLHDLAPDVRLVRFYDPSRGPWKAQRFYGPLSSARFDHHPPPPGEHPTRSVWYASRSLRGAVAEAFGKLGFVDRDGSRSVVVARVVRPIRLLDLVGVAVRKLGLTQEIASTTEYLLCQAWSRAVYDRYPIVQGIRWRGREIGSINVVLNDRVELTSLTAEVDVEIHHPSVWPRVARAARDCRLDVV